MRIVMDFQSLFLLGMKRELPDLIHFDTGKALNIGSSPTDKYHIPGAMELGKPDWWFPLDYIPADTSSITTIHCYHFMEHLDGNDAIAFLRECERVMIPGASVMNFCVPYYNSGLQAKDLTHKSQWNEETFKNLFDNEIYTPAGQWHLKVHFQIIAAVVERNLCLIGQLVR
jgi:hypothetical protein